MQKNHVRIRFFGDITALSPELQALAEEASRESDQFTDSQVNLCINYGSRDEIVRAAKKWAQHCVETGEDPETLTEEDFSRMLYSGDFCQTDRKYGYDDAGSCYLHIQVDVVCLTIAAYKFAERNET